MKIDLASPGRYCAGLGDCVTWAWLAAGADEPMQFAAQGANAEMLRLFGCDVTEDPSGAIDPNFCYRAELNLRCQAPRVKIWSQILGLTSTPVRPQCVLKPVRQPKPTRIVIAPQCHFKSRTWPKAYWLDLNWALQCLGYEVVWLMEHDDQDFSQRGPAMAYWRSSFQQVIEIMMTAAVVVANDSMPAHLAGTLGVPTLAILGPTHPNVFAHVPDVIPMQSKAMECVGCHFSQPYRAACDLLCQGLATTLPRDVAAKVQEIVPIQREQHAA